MGAESFDPGVAGKRAAKRARVLLAAKLHLAGGMIDCRLRDLSRKGALIECKSPPPPGAEVLFERGGSRIKAVVAWCADGRVGIEFDHPIDESELLVHIGRPGASRQVSPQSFYSRPGMMQKMTARDRKLAKAWSIAVGLTLPEKEG